MQARLEPATRARLVGALNLLSSPHAGEAAAAAGAVTRIVQGQGLAWDVLIPLALPAPGRQGQHPVSDFATDLRLCGRNAGRLTEPEARFVVQMASWRGTVSEKQRAWLHKIATRLRAQGVQ